MLLILLHSTIFKEKVKSGILVGFIAFLEVGLLNRVMFLVGSNFMTTLKINIRDRPIWLF